MNLTRKIKLVKINIYFKIKLVNLPCSKNIKNILNDYKIYKIAENKLLELDE